MDAIAQRPFKHQDLGTCLCGERSFLPAYPPVLTAVCIALNHRSTVPVSWVVTQDPVLVSF